MNIELYEGQGARLYITLNGEFSVYGGSDEDTFSVSREGNVYKVDVHPHTRGLCSTHRYDIFAKNSDGKEWLITSGKINVKNRTSAVSGDGISSVEYHLDLELVEGKESKTKQMIVGIPGKQGEQGLPGKSAYQYALDNGYVGTEQDFTNMMVCVKMYAEQAEQARQGAVDAQILAETGAINALKSAQDAQDAVDNIEIPELTPEAIKAVVPISWGTCTTAPTATSNFTIAIGSNARAFIGHSNSIGSETYAMSMSQSIGHGASCLEKCSVAIGHNIKSKKECNVTIGGHFTDSTGTTFTCTTEGTGSITIGAGANTLNNGDTESSNSVTIGCKASNQGADSVVIGAGAKGGGVGDITLGGGSATEGDMSIAIGYGSQSKHAGMAVGVGATSLQMGIAVGASSVAGGRATALGRYAAASSDGLALSYAAKANQAYSTAIGTGAVVSDYGATVIRSTAEDGTYTQLYFSGANTPLANTYENGEAMMGYVVRDSAGNIMTDAEGNAMVGTQKLSVLFPNNRGENAFTPAMLGLDDEWTPKPMFHPSDLDMPQDELSEPEEYQPLPVYPIVEPEIEEMEEIE